jgi:membrane protein implicated in regulation of membrane protease activity
MKLHSTKFALACASSAAVFWLLCSLFVLIMPGMMLSMSGDMLHMNFEGMGWHMSFFSTLIGGLFWAIAAGIFGWLLARIYNRLL